MKEDRHDHHHHHHHPQQAFTQYQRRFWNFITYMRTSHKLTAYFILLILTYAFGYYSAPSSSVSSSSSSNNSNRITLPPTPTTAPLTVSTTASVTKCPAVNKDQHNRFGSACVEPVPPELVRQKILDRVFNGTSPYEKFPPAHVAHLLRPKRVKGWGSYGAVFENLIREVRPRTIIEVGTFLGASAIHMAQLTWKLGLEAQIICVDDFRGWAGFRDRFSFVPMQNGDVMLLAQFLQNVIYSNATGSILPLPFGTGSALQKLCEWGVLADLIEVDAGHDFHSAWSDINRAHKLLRPGGVLFGHDYFLAYDKRGVRRAVDLFAQVNGFSIRVDGQHWVLSSS